MPPFFYAVNRKTVLLRCVREVRYVMHERINGHCLVVAVKLRLGAEILAERMKLADEKLTAGSQDSRRFGEDKRKLLDMFKDEVAGD